LQNRASESFFAPQCGQVMPAALVGAASPSRTPVATARAAVVKPGCVPSAT
jgi:hypothetical protein